MSSKPGAGQGILSKIDDDAGEFSDRDIAIASAIAFFHNDFIIDISRSDPSTALQMLSEELLGKNLHLPQRFGRTLYDKFNAISDGQRIECPRKRAQGFC